MSSSVTKVLGTVTQLVLEFVVEELDVKETKRTLLFVLSVILLILEPLSRVIVPKPSLRLILIAGVYSAILAGGLAITQRLRLRRWVIFVIPLLFAALAACGMYTYSFLTSDVYRIAPDFTTFGHPLPYTSAYGTNARIETQIYGRRDHYGPDRFIRLKFDLLCRGAEDHCNAGWMLTSLQGMNKVSSRQDLVFQVRGAQGNEVIGVAMKDCSLTEVRIFDLAKFIKGSSAIDTEWKTVYIPLREFVEVDFRSLDGISFFVDAQYTAYQTIDVDIGNIHLE
jgi:hypothetical protein